MGPRPRAVTTASRRNVRRVVNLDAPTPRDLADMRDLLRRAGEPVDEMSDDQVVDEMRRRVRASVPAPAVPASSKPISGHAWLADALTAGGFQPPEDKHQHAGLEDGGEPVDLAVLGVLVMRHLSGAAPEGWTDEALAQRTAMPLTDIRRGQKLLDQVAAEVGRPATPSPRWWEHARPNRAQRRAKR